MPLYTPKRASRVTCPECGRQPCVRTDGLIWMHRTGGWGSKVCDGSGLRAIMSLPYPHVPMAYSART